MQLQHSSSFCLLLVSQQCSPASMLAMGCALSHCCLALFDSSTQTAWRRTTIPPTHMLDAKSSKMVQTGLSVIKLSAETEVLPNPCAGEAPVRQVKICWRTAACMMLASSCLRVAISCSAGKCRALQWSSVISPAAAPLWPLTSAEGARNDPRQRFHP